MRTTRDGHHEQRGLFVAAEDRSRDGLGGFVADGIAERAAELLQLRLIVGGEFGSVLVRGHDHDGLLVRLGELVEGLLCLSRFGVGRSGFVGPVLPCPGQESEEQSDEDDDSAEYEPRTALRCQRVCGFRQW
ncbi:hypothetical protein D3I60_03390 [Brevibacterium permense]|uniref:hypothetical protein n=1 Tax=Brevibacterium permense TaxID=234834 RepID=UPI0021D3A2ED|nr:hypothetical protein [Brevibacterium permense]MCU4296136.1 hypothetical protein [Brevibacterium permense]